MVFRLATARTKEHYVLRTFFDLHFTPSFFSYRSSGIFESFPHGISLTAMGYVAILVFLVES